MADIVIHSRMLPGISITHMAEAIRDHFVAAGHAVEIVDPGDSSVDLKKVWHKKHVLALDAMTLVDALQSKAAMYTPPRTFPTNIVSLWTGNWEDYALIDQFAYVGCLLKPKVNGIPIKHVSHSHHTDSGVKEFLRKWLPPSVAGEVASRLSVNLFGISPEFMQDGENAPDLMIVPYNRVNQSQKNLKLHVEISRQYVQWASAKGFDPKIDFFYAGKFSPDKKSYDVGADLYHYQPQNDRPTFIASASRYGTFLSTSMYESFGIYYLELLASGVVGVFLDRPWVRRLLPDYRFIAAKSDLPGMLAWVRENHAEAREYVIQTVRPKIAVDYSLDRFCAQLLKDVLDGQDTV